MIKVTLKDGSSIEVKENSTILDVAKQISEGLARVATCGEIDGEVKDLRYEITKDCNLTIHTFDSSLDGKKAYWHTTSHIMAQAVKRLFPGVKFAIGPSIDNGFYYDFDVEKPFTDEDKEKIEAEMKKIIKENLIKEDENMRNFRDFSPEERRNYITLSTGEYFPDILEDACRLYAPVLEMFSRLLHTSESSSALYISISQSPNQWM